MSTYTGTITKGITLAQNPATLAAGGYVTYNLGDAVYGSNATAWNFTNLGTIKTTGSVGSGIDLRAGGRVTNGVGARIAGIEDGVYIYVAAGTVINSGTIQGTGTSDTSGYGVQLRADGSVGNAQNALISGVHVGVVIHGSAGTVSNLGTIAGTGTAGYGVYLNAGTVVNGATAVTSALISGVYDGVDMAGTDAGTVSNFGTISGGPVGVYIKGRGTVINGSTNAKAALISAANYAIKIASAAAGTVDNFGTIISTGTENLALQIYPDAIFMAGTGTVVNGATDATSALISAEHRGIYISGAGISTVCNFGTISGIGASGYATGVYLNAAGIISNAQSGLITGMYDGVVMQGTAASTVINLGTITGGGNAGVYIKGAGTVINGATNATSALIRGADTGLGMERIAGSATVTNFGTIIGGHGTTGLGIYVGDRGSVVNGASNVTSALISGGAAGIQIDGASGTVTNFGTVTAGTNGIGIYLVSGQVTNFGTIIAPGSAATAVRVRYGVFVNKGVVQGSVYGIEFGLSGTGSGSGVVTALGTVTGTVGIGAAPGITAGYTVSVGGTVMSSVGSAGTAVSLGGLKGRLIVDPGAVFTGMLNGGGGSSVLEISGGGSGGSGGAVGAGGATAYVSLGSVVNFSALQVDASATVGAAGVLSIPTLVNQGQVNIGSGDQFAFASVSGSSTGVIDLRTGGTVTFSGVVANQTLYFHPPGGTALIEEANAFGATITDFAAGDTIDLTGFVASGKSFANNALVLTDTLSNHVTLAIVGSFSTSSFVLASDGGTGTDITTVACFCRGTRVLTEAGEVAVEDLAIGDRVVTLSSEARPIKWIGRRAYDGRFAATNHAVLPIRIEAGALGDGVPARDLFVSPEHALYLDDALVPAGLLANGATIRQVERVERVEYFHIELDSHDVILAEGAPAETFVDCDNRLMFQNGAEYAALYPDDDRPAWMFCAPRVEAGSPALAAVRAALLARAEELGHRLELDPDPDLHLIVDGGTIWPDRIAGERYRFRIPAGARAVSLASRSAVPAEIEAGSRDHRRLGVPVERIVLSDAERSIEAWHGDAALCEGFHAGEDSQRWTDGLARLPEKWLRSFPGGATLEVRLVRTGLCYRAASPVRIAAEVAA